MSKIQFGILIVLVVISFGSILIGALAKLEHLWWGTYTMASGLAMQLVLIIAAASFYYKDIKANRK